LQQFNRQSGMPFLTYRLPNRFEITSNTSTLKELTQQYTTCPLISFLTEKLSVPICIGWGSAGNISEAYQNGLRALKQATLYGDCATFISLENNVMIGPLSSTQRMVYNDIPDKNLIQISERVGISPLYLNKILYIIQQKQGNTLSSEELSFFLNVTTRSASRILQKLEEAGKLDDTVIVLSADHYPYGLTDEEYSELLGHEVDPVFEIYKNTLILWSADIDEPVHVDKFCSSLDVMPTLANLFGLEYDSRLIMGRDILSDEPGLVIFSNYSFITDKGRYDSTTDTFQMWDGSEPDPEYVAERLSEVQNRVAYSASILDNDYYRVVFGAS